MKNFLVVTALLEAGTGFALIVSPTVPVSLLFGVGHDAPGGLVVARIAGAALLALGLACWLARNEGRSGAGRGIIAAMLLYNVAASAVIAWAGLGLKWSAIGLWPALAVHVGLAIWSAAGLQGTESRDP